MTPDRPKTWPEIVSALEAERDAFKQASLQFIAERDSSRELVRTFWRAARGTSERGQLAHLIEQCQGLPWLNEEEPDCLASTGNITLHFLDGSKRQVCVSGAPTLASCPDFSTGSTWPSENS